MNPKSLSLIAICLIAITGGIAWLHRKTDASTTAAAPLAETQRTRASDRNDRSRPSSANPHSETKEEREERESLLSIERDKTTAIWLGNVSVAFEKTSKHLSTDLNLSAEKSDQVKAIFARRQQELAGLLANMYSGDETQDYTLFRKITGLIRNKGLRADLEGVLSAEQLAAFDASEAKRERETHEARAYRDLAQINEVVQLTDSQKQSVLEVLTQHAPARVEQEADSRAFMSLMYGGIAADMDSSHMRCLANMVNMDPALTANFQYGSAEHQKWIMEQNTARIENELSPLQNILTEDQLTRYREHLEAEPPR